MPDLDDIKAGYVDSTGKPLKCWKCGYTEFEQFDTYMEEHWVVEYSLKCKQCGSGVGHWAYGTWID